MRTEVVIPRRGPRSGSRARVAAVVLVTGVLVMAGCSGGGTTVSASLRSEERELAPSEPGSGELEAPPDRGDDDPTEPVQPVEPREEPSTEHAAFCAEVDRFVDGLDDGMAAMRAALSRLAGSAPDELTDEFDVLEDLLADIDEIGDVDDLESVGSVLDRVLDPDALDAYQRVSEFVLDECDLAVEERFDRFLDRVARELREHFED